MARRRKFTDAELNAAHEDPAVLPPGTRKAKAPADTPEKAALRRAIAAAYAKQTRAAKRGGSDA